MAEAAPDRALVAAQHVVALFASAASPSAECVQALTDLMRNAMCVALVVVDTPTAPLLQTCVYLDPPSSWTILLGRGAGEPDSRLMASRLMRTKTGVVLSGGARSAPCTPREPPAAAAPPRAADAAAMSTLQPIPGLR